MSTIREGHLRDLPHPSLNEVLKSNTYSAIKLLKTGKVCDYKSHSSVKRERIFGVRWNCLADFLLQPQVLVRVNH